MADDALMAAGVAIDALFEFINADKLKLVRVVEKPTMAPSFFRHAAPLADTDCVARCAGGPVHAD